MPDPARILIIDNLAAESSRRGVYRAFRTLCGFDVHLLVPRAWKETREAVASEDELSDNITLHRSGSLFGFRHQRVLYTGLFGVVRRTRPDFILAATQPENYAAAQVIFARNRYAPGAQIGLFCSRNIDFRSKGFPYKLAFTHRLADSLTRRSNIDICFYRPNAAERLLQGYAKRLMYVPHVVDCSVFARRMKEAGPHIKDETFVSYVGRLVREKGIFVILEALRSLPESIRLKFIGTGPEETSLRQMTSQLGLSSRVEIAGPVSYAAMPEVLNATDILVLPSVETEQWTELFGRILIEAMACGVPVVASRSGGIPEVVGSAARLVNPGNPAELALAIAGLAADSEAKRDLGRAGRERALRLYDIPIVARTMGQAIQESLGN